MILNKGISVIGLGFIGLPLYTKLVEKFSSKKVFGIDKFSKKTLEKFEKLKSGINPIESNDKYFDKIVKNNSYNKLSLHTNLSKISESEVVVISIGFDLTKKNSMKNIVNIFTKILEKITENTLIILETTVLPGTSEKIILPIIDKISKRRGIDKSKIYFSYSFERIMPGKNYIKSLNNHRCFASKDVISKKKTINFLKKFINLKEKKLFYFESLTECETVKVIENGYRALNIAFIDEWTKFCFERKLNLNKILESIRMRDSHKNIMRPGLGVGGYCLTKDLIFGDLSNKFFGYKKIKFPLMTKVKKINENMVRTSFNFIKKSTSITNKKILILGSSYKEDVFDLRLSPSEVLYKMLKKYTKKIEIYEPVTKNPKKFNFNKNLSNFSNFNIVIFANGHTQIKNISINKFKKKPIYFDLNNILSKKKVINLRNKKFKLKVLGDKE